ncbi:beta-galactosidase [Tamlana flava]|uniref:beta-galactosidase n=1 Tax=Tamlana flava TaxID=3158572 RepID=UPI00351AEBE4
MKQFKLIIMPLFVFIVQFSQGQSYQQDHLYYGVAYYDEYMPYERLQKDIEMMKDANINFVRIAESTWSTVEPQDGIYNFSSIDRVLDAMHENGIDVIFGTPSYAIPAWLAHKHPEILATTPDGKTNVYGPRQNMDISHETYRFYVERVIRKMMEHVKDHPAIIGYQVDNETKHFNTAGEPVQKKFVTHMKEKFKSLDSINSKYGLDYWSNRINSWEEFPSVNGTINASFRSEFEHFQRLLVTDFLSWQADIIRDYSKPNQFITHNHDLEWRGYSFGMQPDADHFEIDQALDVVGIDIYHPTQDHLTGIEISFGGDMARSFKDGKNYFIIETEAQGFAKWTPYPGQLRLQAFSHLASGASMVGYWHWHSLHNAIETYWKGLLSHDFEPNPTYNEAKTIGEDFKRLNDHLLGLKKNNDVAFFVSNEAMTAFDDFSFGWFSSEKYNDIVRPFYDALYKMNVGVDFLDPSTIDKLSNYKLIVVPVLYAASDDILEALNTYVENGGRIIYTFKSGFSDENVKVRHTKQPGIIRKATGNYYSQFAKPENVSIKGDAYGLDVQDEEVKYFMELLTTDKNTNVLAYYDHPFWGRYAAITENKYGKGIATYIGFMPGEKLINKIFEDQLKKTKLWGKDQNLTYPIIVKTGTNKKGKTVRYFFNYSQEKQTLKYQYGRGTELLNGDKIQNEQPLTLEPWGLQIVEEN